MDHGRWTTDDGPRTIAGSAGARVLTGTGLERSCGAQAALAQHGAFRRHVAVSGTWPGVADCLLSHQAPLSSELAVSELYLAAGADEAEQAEGMAALVEALSARPGLRLTHETRSGEGHSAGMIAAALLRGLPAVYGGREGV